MRRALLAATSLVWAGAAHAQALQSGTIGGMPYYILPASGGCSAQTPCSVVTYLGVQSESSGAIQQDVANYFGGAFAQANPHTIVVAPTEDGPQNATINWGGYNGATTPEQAQMVAVVQGVERQMGNTVNPADSVVTGGSLGGTGTQAALIAFGPKGTVQPGVFSAGLSFDASDWSAAGNSTQIAALCGVPLTAVHGTADTNQNISYDQNLVAAIDGNAACDNSATLVPIQGHGHGTWSDPSVGYGAGTGSGTPLGWLTAQLSVGAGATAQVTSQAQPAPASGGAAPASVMPVAAPAGTEGTETTPASTAIAPGQDSVTDCSGNVWTINSNNKILENGQPVVGGGDTASPHDPELHRLWPVQRTERQQHKLVHPVVRHPRERPELGGESRAARRNTNHNSRRPCPGLCGRHADRNPGASHLRRRTGIWGVQDGQRSNSRPGRQAVHCPWDQRLRLPRRQALPRV